MFIQLESVDNFQITSGQLAVRSLVFDAKIIDEITNEERHYQFEIPRALLNAKIIKNKKTEQIENNYFHTERAKLRLDFEMMCTEDGNYYKCKEIK